jgi:hypothetical protein
MHWGTSESGTRLSGGWPSQASKRGGRCWPELDLPSSFWRLQARVFLPKGLGLDGLGAAGPAFTINKISRRLHPSNRGAEVVPDVAGEGNQGREHRRRLRNQESSTCVEQPRRRHAQKRTYEMPGVEPSARLQLSLHARERRVELGSKTIHDRDDCHRSPAAIRPYSIAVTAVSSPMKLRNSQS